MALPGAVEAKAVFLSTPSARRATWKKDNLPTRQEFLSTPSARRATSKATDAAPCHKISIHALCEEGDWSRQQVGALIR